MGADRDDELRAGFVREQHRDVFAGSLGDELVVLDAPRDEVLAAGSAPVGVHVVDELGAAVERGLRDGVEVTDDHVGLQPDLEERVGAAVDADEHRSVLADVRAQRGEIAAVVVTAHHYERVSTGELRRAAAGARAART